MTMAVASTLACWLLLTSAQNDQPSLHPLKTCLAQVFVANQVEAVGPDDRRDAQAVTGYHSGPRTCGVAHSYEVFRGSNHDVGTSLKNGRRWLYEIWIADAKVEESYNINIPGKEDLWRSASSLETVVVIWATLLQHLVLARKHCLTGSLILHF